MRTPLVAARTVAQALADLATGRGPAAVPEAAGPPIPEIAGPRAENLVDMATLLAAARIPGEGRGREQAGRPRTATSIREDLVAELPRFRAIRGKARAMSLPDDDEHLRALAAEGRVLLAITPDTPPTSWTSWGLD